MMTTRLQSLADHSGLRSKADTTPSRRDADGARYKVTSCARRRPISQKPANIKIRLLLTKVPPVTASGEAQVGVLVERHGRQAAAAPDPYEMISFVYPRSLPQATVELLRWADNCSVEPLPPEMVPGASGPELKRLAALGALARGLAGVATGSWPERVAAWTQAADESVPESLLASIEAQLDDSTDLLAETYEHVVSGLNRRRLGTFFTPSPIVKHMVNIGRTLSSTPKQIIDPGAGVGAFTLASLNEWQKAKTHAVDINVVTLGLLAARIANRRLGDSKNLDLVAEDYLSWIQGSAIERVQSPVLYIGNPPPPYTRHQHRTKKDKDLARTAAGDLVASGLAGLSTYFLAATVRTLRANDSICFLVPATWCETRYGREIRVRLWSIHKRRVELHLFPSHIDVFPGTQVTAMILAVGPEKSRRQPFIAKMVAVDDVVNQSVRETATKTIGRDAPCPDQFTRFFAGKVTNIKAPVVLGDHVRIRRGVATGASSFFFLSGKVVAAYSIPEQYLKRALVKPSSCQADSFTSYQHNKLLQKSLSRWLLDLRGYDLNGLPEAVRSYLNYGKSVGAHDTHLARSRRDWFAVEEVTPPDLFFAPVSKPVNRTSLIRPKQFLVTTCTACISRRVLRGRRRTWQAGCALNQVKSRFSKSRGIITAGQ